MNTRAHPSPVPLVSHLRPALILTVVLTFLVSGAYPLVVYGLAQMMFPAQANGSLITKGSTVIGSALIGQNFSDPKYFHPRPSAAGNGYDPTSSGGSNLGPTSAKFLNGTTKQPAPPTPAAGTTDPAATAPATAAPAPPLPLVVDNDGIQLRVLHYCDDNGIALLAMRDGMMVDLTPFKTSDGWDEVKLITAFNDADHPLTVKASAMIPVDAVTASASGLDPHISMANAMLQLARVAKARGFKEEVIGRMVLMAIDGRERLFGEPGINVLRLNLALDAVR